MSDREISYDVRVWGVSKRPWASGAITYRVRWVVAGQTWHDSFRTRALADSFRSELLSLSRQGEPFDVATGQPVSRLRVVMPSQSWYDHACAYVDMKWPHAAGKSRQGIADSLATITPALLTSTKSRPSVTSMRAALYGWSFNARRRAAGPPDEHLRRAERWVAANTRPVSDLADPAVLRPALDALALRMDGKPASASTVSRKRAIFYNCVEYAVELGHLTGNPIASIKWRAPKITEAVNPRVVINHGQAQALLAAVRQLRSGPPLVAFFAVMYYAALRPGEAVDLRKDALSLPKSGWGELYLSTSAPSAGRSWSKTGTRREPRQLKHRGTEEVRIVPCPPALTTILRDHLDEHGTTPDGRLFRGVRGGPLSESLYGRLWAKARVEALTDEDTASPLARRPYDLRHAAVSTWLNGGVPAPQVAAWAGHSVDVLLRVYAKCIAGQDDIARRRIEEALGDGRS
ncbi:tyrosine-type recombinase/integrase [Pseudonocardia sp. D17]|uniref:tyrosine-type recombinase/integrase n=1 Tax=Pseudonocardia sp. D17 TaxID=882661 RepID=UPI0030D4ECA0|nr:integrase [Pseudonocardia sp. D17]